jgi:hypothetical protein
MCTHPYVSAMKPLKWPESTFTHLYPFRADVNAWSNTSTVPYAFMACRWEILPLLKVKVPGKFHPRTGHEGTDGKKRYRSTLSLTSALDGGGWLRPRPECFTPGKETRYRRLGGPTALFPQVRKISPQPGFDPRTFQPVAIRYTD